jgi:hypothetical protein
LHSQSTTFAMLKSTKLQGNLTGYRSKTDMRRRFASAARDIRKARASTGIIPPLEWRALKEVFPASPEVVVMMISKGVSCWQQELLSFSMNFIHHYFTSFRVSQHSSSFGQSGSQTEGAKCDSCMAQTKKLARTTFLRTTTRTSSSRLQPMCFDTHLNGVDLGSWTMRLK